VNLTAKQQDTLERICSQPDPDKVPGDCPICTEVQISSAEQYFTHVGNHLEQLSLFALPQNVNHESESHNTQFEDNRDQKEASDTSSIIDPQDNSSHNIAKPESDDESQAGGQSSGDPGTSRIEISPPKAFDVYGELALRQVDETSYKRENVVNDSDSRRSLGDDILTGEPNEESGSTTDHSENHDRDITTAEQPSSNPKRTVDSAYSSGSSGSSSYRWDCVSHSSSNHSIPLTHVTDNSSLV
jgi:hypothetical protein